MTAFHPCMVALFTLFCGNLAFSQTINNSTQGAESDPPFVNPAVDPSSWKVTIRQESSDPDFKPPGGGNLQIEGAKNGGVCRLVTSSDGGSKITEWITDGLKMTQQADWSSERVLSIPVVSETPEFDLPTLSTNTFIRTELLNGRMCNYHEIFDNMGTARVAGELRNQPRGEIRVWIDTETLLPVRTVDIGSVVTTSDYKFVNAAPALDLPPVFQSRIDRWEKIRALRENQD